MGFVVPPASTDTERLLSQAADGDAAALGALFAHYRERLKTMVRLRLDRRLQGRVDASDVLQEAFIEAAERLPEYAKAAPAEKMPFFLWLRFLTGQRMLIVHRRHLGAKMRSAKEEDPLTFRTTAAPTHQSPIRNAGVAFSPDGRALVTWGGNAAEVWDHRQASLPVPAPRRPLLQRPLLPRRPSRTCLTGGRCGGRAKSTSADRSWAGGTSAAGTRGRSCSRRSRSRRRW